MRSLSKPSLGERRMSKTLSWIADLLQHGLLKASFIPSGPQRELRDLTRYRVRLTQEKARRGQSGSEDTGRYQFETGGCRQR
jgi:hypothetical protein